MKRSRIACDVVAQILRELPPQLLELARTVPVRFEPRPGPDLLAEGIEPDILGLFSGLPHPSADPGEDPMPARIYLYTDNLWDFTQGDEAAFRREVRLTYLHELGHFLGWDEDQLALRGLD